MHFYLLIASEIFLPSRASTQSHCNRLQERNWAHCSMLKEWNWVSADKMQGSERY